MATYYKYAERQADSFVNWAEIGKNLTDMLQQEFKIREDKKAAIDQATRDSLKVLSDAPTGQHEGLNTWSLKFADEAREAILLQDRLLKSGALKLKDYTIMRQNLNDGTDELFNTIKSYNQVFKNKMERLRNNESQQIELDLMASIEGFSDFSKSKVLIDPNNFTVSIGIMEPDPENKGVMKLSRNVATTSFLRKIQDVNFNRFDSKGAVDEISKGLGTVLDTQILSDEEARGLGINPALQGITRTTKKVDDQIIDQAINAYFSNDFNVTSILTQDIKVDKNGNQYVSNLSGKQGNIIQYVFDNQTNSIKPVLTDEQRQAAKDYLKAQVKGRIDSETKLDIFNKPQPRLSKQPSSPGINLPERINQISNSIYNTAKDNNLEFFAITTDPVKSAENIENILNYDSTTRGKFKVESTENQIIVKDNNDNIIYRTEVSENITPPSTSGFEKRKNILNDIIKSATEYSVEKAVPGSFFQTGGQQSGGASLPSR